MEDKRSFRLPGRANARIFLAGLFTETNTFVEQSTRLDDFQIKRGEALFDFRGNESPMDGFLESAELYEWTVCPGIDYRAAPGGITESAVFEQYWRELREEFAKAGHVDAIFLILHGAMVTEGYPDTEGELLRRIRLLPGAAELPIFAVLDLHANVSQEMAGHASALIPYRENPHTDARGTAVRAAGLLRRALAEKCTPRNSLRHSRILLAAPLTGTAEEPLRSLQTIARQMENSSEHWEVGVAPGFAHADVPDAGLTFWVVDSGNEDKIRRTLEGLHERAHHLKNSLQTQEWSLSEAIDQIERDRKFPALLVEPADNIGGGGPGDMTFVLRALLARPSIGRCGLIINDPTAVKKLAAVDVGDEINIFLGGRGSRLDEGPVDLKVRLVSLTDGCFELTDKQSHLAGGAGSRINMGRTAVVTHGHLTILITSQKTPPFDLGQWTSQGLDPSKLDIIGVKAAVAHRRAYDPITASSYSVLTPGPCSSDLNSLPYEKLKRPIFPFDS